MNKNYDPSAGKAYEVIPDVRVLNMIQNKIGSFEDKFNIDINVLSCEMATEFTRVQQKAVEFDRKMLFCKILKEVIKKHNPTWLFDVIPTGSSVSGLAISNSDLDVAIYIPQAARVVDRECDGKSVSPEEKMVMWREKQINILQIVRLILKNEEQIKHRVNWEKGIQLVQAQIPILKIETSDGIECDISVVMDCFLSSMHNSFFIRQLASCDRFALLCFIVKRWADSTGLKNPKEGGFNSYALVLLVIHFLQCGTYPPVLPNLIKIYENDNFIAQDEKRFPSKLDFGSPFPRPLPKVSKNFTLVAQLFVEFLCYYSEFDFENSFISIRNSRVEKRNSINNKSCISSNVKVYIEDPFDSHNPGRTVHSVEKMRYIFRATLKKFVPDNNENKNKSKNADNDFKLPSLNDILTMKLSDNLNGRNEDYD